MARLGGFDDSQRLQIDTGGPETVAATLKALFHGAADTHQRGAGGGDNVAQAPHGLAVGHEIVNNKEVRKVYLGDNFSM